MRTTVKINTERQVLEGDMENFKKNAIVGQSGGPTAAINATLSGVIRGAMESTRIDKLYGMRYGMEGFLEGKTVLLNQRFCDGEDELTLLERTPSAALGSCRYKLPDPMSEKKEDVSVYENIFSRFAALDIGFFFYIGGNDSMDTVAKLTAYADRIGKKDVLFVGVPKTIDNDLALTDHAPGYGSAAKYVATTVREILCDCAVYTVKAVTVVEIMGRDAGWLTAASAVGRAQGAPVPDYVYLPERAFDMESFLSDVERAFEKHPNVVIAVSEGIRYADGSYVGEGSLGSQLDRFGHRDLGGAGRVLVGAVRERFGCKARSVELNLSQRCAGHLLSATDIQEAVAIGREAVACVERGESGVMLVFKRLSNAPYQCEIQTANIGDVANEVGAVPASYINEAGNHVTEACLAYLLPLVAGECPPVFRNGIPEYFAL